MSVAIFLVAFVAFIVLVSYAIGKVTKPPSAYEESHKHAYGIEEDSAGIDSGDGGAG